MKWRHPSRIIDDLEAILQSNFIVLTTVDLIDLSEQLKLKSIAAKRKVRSNWTQKKLDKAHSGLSNDIQKHQFILI